jgi:hypothetical protein
MEKFAAAVISKSPLLLLKNLPLMKKQSPVQIAAGLFTGLIKNAPQYRQSTSAFI